MAHRKNLLLVLGEWWEAREESSAQAPSHSRRIPRWLPTPGNAIFSLVLVFSLLWAQSVGALNLGAAAGTSTSTIAYQGRLADSEGNPLTDTLNMSFRLYGIATGSAPLWTEQWTGSNGVQVSDGLFNVMLGSLEPIPQNIITGNDNLFLGITVGTDDEMSPRVQLGSVPFAVQALTVPDGTIDGKTLADHGFGTNDRPLLNFVPVSPRISVLHLQGVSTIDWTDLDLSQWLPQGAEAVVLYGGARDSSSATTAPEIRFDKPGVHQGVFVFTPGAPNNHWQIEQGIVPVDANRHVEYKINASGSGTFTTEILIVGYYERANRP